MFKEMCDKRNSIVQEILQTEKNYVNNLKNVEKIFMKPLIENSESDDPFISKADVRTIFSELKVILGLNEVFLKDLKNLIEKNWSSTALISPLFLKICPHLRWYHSYISNYDKCHNTIKKLKATNPKFKQFIQQCESKPELNYMDLESLLIQPVQRIPQYNLLLTDLFKSTHEEHPDYFSTKEALAEFNELGNYVNEKKRESENIEKVVSISSKLKGFSNLAVSYRRLQLEEDFEVLIEGTNDVQKVKVFLFNDLLLITQKQDDGLHVIDHANFDRISILKDDSLSKVPVMSLKIKDKKCNFMCSSLNVKNNWIGTIKKLSERYSLISDRKREHFLKLCEINNNLNKLNNQNEPLTTLSLGILNLNIKAAQNRPAGKQDGPNEDELKSVYDEDKARSKRIKELIEKEVLNILSKEGYSSIDSYLKEIGYEAHYVIPFEMLNDKNTLISRPALLLINKSFVIIIEKGKAVATYHLLDISSLTSQVYPDFTIKFIDNNEILGRSEHCDDIIYIIRKTYLHSFPGIPENRTWKVNVGGITPKIIPPLNLVCGGFKRTYRTVCDWIDHKPRNDIIWDVTHFTKSKSGGIFDLSKIEDLSTNDLKAITISLRYNQYFKEFVCRDLNLSKDYVLLLADMFKYNFNIKKISFSNNNLSKDTMSLLLESISQDSHDFEEIEISNNVIDDKNISHFVTYFEDKNTMSLNKLDINNTSVGPKGISQLFAKIKKNVSLYHSLQHINLSGNRLDSEGSRTLASYLATPCAITHLNISNTQSRLTSIFEALMRGCKYLQYINVSQNKITKNMMSSIINFIKGSDSLLHFDISATSISGESIGKIIQAVSENPYIKRLSLIANDNNYEYIDAVEISKAFQNMKGIETLSINNSDLSDEGISVIAKSLKNASNGLKKLSIDGNFKLKSNKARKSMVKNLCSLLTSNMSTLTHFSMVGGNKSSASLKQDIIPLLNSLPRCKLKEINISGHKMGNTGAFALARAFQSNMPLEVLSFDENGIGIEGLTSIIESLKTCKNILNVHLPIIDIGLITSQGDEKVNKKISILLHELNQQLIHNNLKVQLQALSKKKQRESDSRSKSFEHKLSKKSKNTPAYSSADSINVTKKSVTKKKLKTPRSSRNTEYTSKESKKTSTTESSSSSGSLKIDTGEQSNEYTTENRIRRNSIVARKFTRTQSRNTADVLDLATKKIDEKDETFGNIPVIDNDNNLDIEILEDDEEDEVIDKPGYTNEDSDSENEDLQTDSDSEFEEEILNDNDIRDESLSATEKEPLDDDQAELDGSLNDNNSIKEHFRNDSNEIDDNTTQNIEEDELIDSVTDINEEEYQDEQDKDIDEDLNDDEISEGIDEEQNHDEKVCENGEDDSVGEIDEGQNKDDPTDDIDEEPNKDDPTGDIDEDQNKDDLTEDIDEEPNKDDPTSDDEKNNTKDNEEEYLEEINKDEDHDEIENNQNNSSNIEIKEETYDTDERKENEIEIEDLKDSDIDDEPIPSSQPISETTQDNNLDREDEDIESIKDSNDNDMESINSKEIESENEEDTSTNIEKLDDNEGDTNNDDDDDDDDMKEIELDSDNKDEEKLNLGDIKNENIINILDRA